VASLGDGFGYGAVPLLALVVDPSPIPVAAVAAADTLPWLVLALPAGALADRMERGRLMAVVNIARGFILALLAVLVASHRIDLGLLVLLVFANGGARAIYYSGSQATVPELIETKSLAHANGILSGTEAATEHLGGPILGTLAFAATRALPFFADAVAVGASGLSLLGFRTRRPDAAQAHGSILDGARRLLRDPALRLLVSLLAALAGLQGLVMGVLVIVATVDWGVPKGLYGVFLAAGALGNVPGALLADRVANRIGSIQTLIASAVISGLAYLVMAMSHDWLLAGAAFAVVSFAVYAGSVIANSLRQRLTPRELMGRVGSAWRGIVWGAFPIGSLVGGALASLGGLRLPLLIAGVAQCIVAVLLAAPLTRAVVFAERAAATAEAETAAARDASLEPPAPRSRRLHSRSRGRSRYHGHSARTRRR
jgi:MFS family permease